MKLSSQTLSAADIEPGFFLIGLINRFNNSFQAAADAMFEEISWKQVFFLNCVTLFEKPPTIKEMAELLGCSHQNAKQILTKLEKLGFAEVRPDTEDRRKQRIALTKKATVFLQKYRVPSANAMEKIFSSIRPEDVETTIRVMTSLCEQLNNCEEENI